MLPHYLALELPLEASDEEIRNAYLQLVKKHPPEKDSSRFQRITEAYEAVKDERNRIKAKIFGNLTIRDYEGALWSLAKAKEIKRRRVGLQELLEAEKKIKGK